MLKSASVVAHVLVSDRAFVALVRAVGACTFQPCMFMSVVLIGKNNNKKRSFLESRIGEVVPSDSIASLPLVYTL